MKALPLVGLPEASADDEPPIDLHGSDRYAGSALLGVDSLPSEVTANPVTLADVADPVGPDAAQRFALVAAQEAAATADRRRR